MTHIHGLDRGQLLLLPEAIDDYVAADNPVRFIDAFVEGLDLRVAGFERVEPKATGRPGYAPGDLLKLYIYGYLNRVRSSRRLEAECHRNIEVIWQVRSLKPDFKRRRSPNIRRRKLQPCLAAAWAVWMTDEPGAARTNNGEAPRFPWSLTGWAHSK